MIDEEYKQQLRTMHEHGMFNNGLAAYKIVRRFIRRVQPQTLLDFGCGHGALIKVIKEKHPTIKVHGYDPGNKLFDHFPESPVDVVVSTDALEHVEPEHIHNTIARITQLIDKYGFFRIACYPANKSLPDGRNAHLIVEHPQWWREMLTRTGGLVILRERIQKVDKRDRWPQVFGYTYDVIVQKSSYRERRWLTGFCIRYVYPNL